MKGPVIIVERALFADEILELNPETPGDEYYSVRFTLPHLNTPNLPDSFAYGIVSRKELSKAFANFYPLKPTETEAAK